LVEPRNKNKFEFRRWGLRAPEIEPLTKSRNAANVRAVLTAVNREQLLGYLVD